MLDKDIERYYSDSLDLSIQEEKELNSVLEKMNLIEDIHKNLELDINISEIVDEASRVRLRKDSFKFSVFAIIFAIILTYASIQYEYIKILIFQVVLLISLLIINYILTRKEKNISLYK